MNVIRNVEHLVRNTNQHGRDQQCFWPGTLHRDDDFRQVVKSVCSIAVRGDHRLVLNRDAHFPDVRVSCGVWLPDKQVDLSFAVTRRSDISPDPHNARIAVRPERRSRALQILDHSVRDQI